MTGTTGVEEGAGMEIPTTDEVGSAERCGCVVEDEPAVVAPAVEEEGVDEDEKRDAHDFGGAGLEGAVLVGGGVEVVGGS